MNPLGVIAGWAVFGLIVWCLTGDPVDDVLTALGIDRRKPRR